jgi:RHS repeat-associated protein
MFLNYQRTSATWATSNTSGTQTGLWRYDAYGNLANGVPTSPFGFAGEYRDAATGYTNLRARWYQPQTGEFTTRDPAFAQTHRAYAYAEDDPVNNIDPSGNWAVGECGGGVVEVALGIGLGATGDVCLVRTVFGSGDHIGFTATAGGSTAGLGASAGIGAAYSISDADGLHDLGGWFQSVIVSVPTPLGVGASAAYFWGTGSQGQPVHGVNLGVGIGPGISVGVFDTYTWVHQFDGGGFLGWEGVVVDGLQKVWDALVPWPLTVAANVYSYLNEAEAQAASGGAGGKLWYCP